MILYQKWLFLVVILQLSVIASGENATEALVLSKTFQTENIYLKFDMHINNDGNENAFSLIDESLHALLLDLEDSFADKSNESDPILSTTSSERNLSFGDNVLSTNLPELDIIYSSTVVGSTMETEVENSVNETVNSEIHGGINQTENLIENFLSLYPIESWKQHGYFTVDYIKLINPHWLQFPPTSNMVHYILGLMYCLIFCVGVSGNLLVIYMFMRCRSLRTPANTLIINLAVSDFLMMSKTPIFIYNSFYFGPALGSLACETYGFIGGLTGTVSIVTLAAISVDRFLVIVYPLDPNKRFTGVRTKLVVMTIWIYGFVFSTLPLLEIGVGRYIPEGLLTSCSFDYLSKEKLIKNFIYAFFCAAWILPFCIIVFCYTNILKVVVQAEKTARNQKVGSISSRHCKNEEKRRTEIKLAGVVVIVIMLWFLAWTPYAAVALLGVSGYQSWITPIASMIPALFCKVASCIDPFIYAVTHPRFRTEIRSMLLGKARRRSTFRTTAANTDDSLNESNSVEIEAPAPVAVIQTDCIKRTNSILSNKSECVEEILMLVDLPLIEAGDLSRTNFTNVDYARNANISKPPSWYVKPSFARQDSRLKSLKRHLSVRRDIS